MKFGKRNLIENDKSYDFKPNKGKSTKYTGVNTKVRKFPSKRNLYK